MHPLHPRRTRQYGGKVRLAIALIVGAMLLPLPALSVSDVVIPVYSGPATVDLEVGGLNLGVKDLFRTADGDFYAPMETFQTIFDLTGLRAYLNAGPREAAIKLVDLTDNPPPRDWISLRRLGQLTERTSEAKVLLTPDAALLLTATKKTPLETLSFDDEFSLNTEFRLSGRSRGQRSGRDQSGYGSFYFYGAPLPNLRFSSSVLASTEPTSFYGGEQRRVSRGQSAMTLRTDWQPARFISLGDNQSGYGFLTGSINFAGLSVSNHRSIYETEALSTVFKFQGVAREASTLELYYGDRLVRREQLPPSAYSVETVLPAQPSLARIVLTDLAGNQRVIERDLYPVEGLITEGEHQYSAHAGLVRRGENAYSGVIVAVDGRLGLLPSLTLSYEATAVGKQQVATTGFRAGSFLGSFGLDAGLSHDSSAENNAGFGQSVQVSWRNRFDMGHPFTAGVVASKNHQYVTPLNPSQLGNSVTGFLGTSITTSNYVSFGLGLQSVVLRGASASSVSGSISRRGLALGLTGTYVSRSGKDDQTYFMSLGYTPIQGSMRALASYRDSASRGSTANAQLSGSAGRNRYYSLVASRRDISDRQVDSYALYASTPVGPLRSSLAAFSNGSTDTERLDVSGQTSLSRHGLYLVDGLGRSSGLTLLSAPDGAVDAKIAGRSQRVEKGDSAMIATPAKRTNSILVDTSSLPLGWVAAPVDDVTVRPWRLAKRDLHVVPPGFFLTFRPADLDKTVMVNGKAFTVMPHGVFVDNPRLGINDIIFESRALKLELGDTSDQEGPLSYAVSDGKIHGTSPAAQSPQ